MNGQTIFAYKDFVRIDGVKGELLAYDNMQNPDAAFFGDEIVLPSAKNQTVSFQIGIVPERGTLQKLSITLTDLKAEDGAVIGKENISLFTEWFHTIQDAESDTLAPDCLYPFENETKPFAIPLDMHYLSAQKAGAVWADVWVSGDAASAVYTGTVIVDADGVVREFKLSVDVGNFSVPKENMIVADLNNYASGRFKNNPKTRDNEKMYEDGSYIKMEHAYFKLARDHRSLFHLLPYSHTGAVAPVFVPELEGEGKTLRVKNWDLFDQFYAPLLDGTLFKDSPGGAHPLEFIYMPFNFFWPANYEKWGQKGYRTEFRRILMEFVRHFEEKGWDKTHLELFLNSKKDFRTIPYTVDEVWYEHDQDIIFDFYEMMKGIYETSPCKFHFRMDSSNHFHNHYDSVYSDMCDMWIAAFTWICWCPESTRVMREKDNIFWIYGGSHNAISENLLTMYTWPAYCLMMGPTGFVVWNTTGYGPDPLRCPVQHGGQNLFYPGEYFNIEEPLPSIRLKNLRNAMQVTELAMALRATRKEHQMENFINEIWGMKSNADWYVEPPEFFNTPPRYWDFDEDFGKYCLTPLHRSSTPDVVDALREGVYAMHGKTEVKRDKKVEIKFQ